MGGDSQTGGGGSVFWSVDVDNVDNNPVETTCEDHGGGRYHQRGHDNDGVAGIDKFTISIRIPEQALDAQALLAALQGADTSEAGRVKFALPIERHKDQIRITWGNHPVAARGKKIFANAHVAAGMGHLAKLAPAKKQASAKKKASTKKRAAARKRKASSRRSKGR